MYYAFTIWSGTIMLGFQNSVIKTMIPNIKSPESRKDKKKLQCSSKIQ